MLRMTGSEYLLISWEYMEILYVESFMSSEKISINYLEIIPCQDFFSNSRLP